MTIATGNAGQPFPLTPDVTGFKFPILTDVYTSIGTINMKYAATSERPEQRELVQDFQKRYGVNRSLWETAFRDPDSEKINGAQTRVLDGLFGSKDLSTPTTAVSIVDRGELFNPNAPKTLPDISTLVDLSEQFGILDRKTPMFDELQKKLQGRSPEKDQEYISTDDDKRTVFHVNTRFAGVTAEISVAKTGQKDDSYNDFTLIVDKDLMGLAK